ncbi:MAG: hypothetical protein IT363_10945 [Methanoregulaceae archaeon]|nr:hypothetical protein [Methanoregulaceae archaeon]
MYRLSVFDEGGWHPHRYPVIYGPVDGGAVAAAIDEHPVRLLAALLDALTPPVTLTLEVLEPMGLSQSEPVSWTAPPSILREWLESNGTWLEGDARLSVTLADGDGDKARFDEHDLIWLAGDLGRFEPFLLAAGLLPGEIEIPFPHGHQYREEWTPVFEQMLRRLRA